MRRPGASLIEMIVLIGITIMIGGALFALVRSTWSLNTFVSESLISQQDILKALKTFTLEVRSANESSLGSYPIATAATNTFMFYSDQDFDGLYDRVRYYVSGTTLKKGVVKPTGNPLTYNVANEKISDVIHSVANGTSTPVFSYFGSSYDGAATATPLTVPVDATLVRLVKFNVLIDRTAGIAPGVLNFETEVSIRNLKDNL
jgi:hypothetical protein